jgi:hypothetical protein
MRDQHFASIFKEHVEVKLYDGITAFGKQEALHQLRSWILNVHLIGARPQDWESYKKSAEKVTRIAGQAHSWFFDGYIDILLEFEKGNSQSESFIVFLCGYPSMIKDIPTAKSIIRTHTHVILENPLSLYQSKQ